MPLTDVACRNAICPAGKPRERYSDSLGMYLEVTPKGRKYWRLKYRFGPRKSDSRSASIRRSRWLQPVGLETRRASFSAKVGTRSPRARKQSSFVKLRLRTRSKRSHAPGMSSGDHPGRIITLST